VVNTLIQIYYRSKQMTMNISVLTLAIGVVMIVAAFTSIEAIGYKESKSTTNTTVCTNDQPCHNTTVVCTNGRSCTTTSSNSTSSDQEIIQPDESWFLSSQDYNKRCIAINRFKFAWFFNNIVVLPIECHIKKEDESILLDLGRCPVLTLTSSVFFGWIYLNHSEHLFIIHKLVLRMHTITK
jgi:hypothetical protein